MFGYIRVQKSELLVREYDAYKSVYCGLCKQMGKDYSVFSRFVLSFDCTFYAMFLMSIWRSCEGFEQKKCRFNPMKKCSYCRCGDDALSKAAALNLILYYYKLEDNIADCGIFKRTMYRIVRPVFSHWRRKALKKYSQIDKMVSDMMVAQKKVEQNVNCGLDMAADPTAVMLAGIMSLEADGVAEKRIYQQIGYGLGRFIYLIDAADDYNNDVKSGNFNPLKNIRGNRFDVINNNLSQSLAMVFDAYNLLNLVDFRGIIDNVILKGLPSVQAEVTRKVKGEK